MNIRRRQLIGAMGLAPLVSGCQCLPRDQVADVELSGLRQILKPYRFVKSAAAPDWVVDVHAHFFNAQDVPVQGYLAGPVAHNRPEIAGLVKALAPVAGKLARLAPSARQEFEELYARASSPALMSDTPESIARQLEREQENHRNTQSRKAYDEVLQGTEFERLYNESRGTTIQGLTEERLGPNSLNRAMKQQKTNGAALMSRRASGTADPQWSYRDGLLGFLGYMLSYRWMNLLAYQQAFTTSEEAFGVKRVFGALVDFDHWLEPEPYSCHEDQIRLHQLLSLLSGNYMRPLVAFNPWSAHTEPKRVLDRVEDALKNRGFVGIKIYPPNGFRPLGNSLDPVPHQGAPSGIDLDAALLNMWKLASKLNVPIMAHGAHTMGSDDEHEDAAGPAEWKAALNALPPTERAPVNIGHFGGDEPGPWSGEFAMLMQESVGARLYGDTGYWEKLRCRSNGTCATREHLRALVEQHPVLAERLMYGSDWHMISQESDWGDYARELHTATKDFIKPENFFGGNAIACFGAAAEASTSGEGAGAVLQ